MDFSLFHSRLKWLSQNTLLAGTETGNLLAYDGETGQFKFRLKGHRGEICGIEYDRNKRIILSVSRDKTAKVFKFPSEETAD